MNAIERLNAFTQGNHELDRIPVYPLMMSRATLTLMTTPMKTNNPGIC